MIDLEKNGVVRPDNIEDYIAKGIKDYKWSDEFLIKDLARYGISNEDASLLIKKVKEERGVSNKQTFIEEVEDGDGSGKIHGWLSVLLVLVVLGGILSFVLCLFNTDSAESTPGSLYYFIESGIAEGLFFLILAIYAVVRVALRKPDGIFLLKAYLIIVFISNIIVLLSRDYSSSDALGGIYSSSKIIYRLIFQAACLAYLFMSTQVKELFPKNKRKVHIYDWLIVGIYPLIFVFAILYGIFSSSSSGKDDMQRYVEKVSSWNLPRTKNTEVSYDRKNNTLHFKQKLQIEEIYADNPQYIATLKKMDNMLSESSVAILAIEAMTSYDSLVDYLDATKADFSFTICLPDGTIILNKDFDYNFLNSIDDNAKRTYQEEKLFFQFETANSICPFEIEEGLWCKSIQFRKDFNLVEYTYQLQVDTPWMGMADYNQLLDDIYGTLPAESLKAMGITVRLFLNNKDGDQLTNMEY